MHDPRIASQEMTSKTIEVTPEEFVEYLNSIAPQSMCTFCGGEWGVSATPDGKTAAFVAAQVPNHSGVGVWFFLASCVDCGNSMLFNASHVTRSIKGK